MFEEITGTETIAVVLLIRVITSLVKKHANRSKILYWRLTINLQLITVVLVLKNHWRSSVCMVP